MTGDMILMYGAAPHEESPRVPDITTPFPFETFDPAKDLVEQVVDSLVPEHHRFTWHGVRFTWTNERHFFGEAIKDRKWRAFVRPDGTRWVADIELCGGKCSGSEATPVAALTLAEAAWLSAVGGLGEP